MVVVPGQPLGELEAKDPGLPVVRRDDAGLGQDGQRAVERGEGHGLLELCVELGRGARAVGVRERSNEGAAALREPDAVRCESLLDGDVGLLHE